MVTQGRAGSVGPDGLQKILWTRSLWEDQPALPWAVDLSVPCFPRSGGVLTAADCGLLGVRDSVRLPLPPRALPPRALAQVLSQWPAHTAQSVPRTCPGTRTHRKDSNSDCLPHITGCHGLLSLLLIHLPCSLGSLSSLFSPTLLCPTAPSGIGDTSSKQAYFTREVGASCVHGWDSMAY